MEFLQSRSLGTLNETQTTRLLLRTRLMLVVNTLASHPPVTKTTSYPFKFSLYSSLHDKCICSNKIELVPSVCKSEVLVIYVHVKSRLQNIFSSRETGGEKQHKVKGHSYAYNRIYNHEFSSLVWTIILCLSYHSNTERLVCSLLSGWATTTGDCLALRWH